MSRKDKSEISLIIDGRKIISYTYVKPCERRKRVKDWERIYDLKNQTGVELEIKGVVADGRPILLDEAQVKEIQHEFQYGSKWNGGNALAIKYGVTSKTVLKAVGLFFTVPVRGYNS